MSVEVRFKKDRTLYLVASLSAGTSIEPSGDADGWSANDLLALAGACLHAAGRRGPQAYYSHWGAASSEVRAAATVGLDGELYAAVRCFADVAQLIDDGTYDAYFQSKHHCCVTSTDGDQQVTVTKGRRRRPGA